MESETSNLWKVPLNPGLMSIMMAAPLPINPKTPTITDKTPSQMVLHIWASSVGISMQPSNAVKFVDMVVLTGVLCSECV